MTLFSQILTVQRDFHMNLQTSFLLAFAFIFNGKYQK